MVPVVQLDFAPSALVSFKQVKQSGKFTERKSVLTVENEVNRWFTTIL